MESNFFETPGRLPNLTGELLLTFALAYMVTFFLKTTSVGITFKNETDSVLGS